jgi:hypothetical protein
MFWFWEYFIGVHVADSECVHNRKHAPDRAVGHGF